MSLRRAITTITIAGAVCAAAAGPASAVELENTLVSSYQVAKPGTTSLMESEGISYSVTQQPRQAPGSSRC